MTDTCPCGGTIVEEVLPVEGRKKLKMLLELCDRCKIVYYLEVSRSAVETKRRTR